MTRKFRKKKYNKLHNDHDAQKDPVEEGDS